MSMDTGAPKQPFRLSMLLYDTRYRSYTIQIVALMLLMLGAAWLIDNTITNLAALGKDFNFAYLSNPAGYDINQRPIEYNSQMTHGRAALVGLLNTLILAVMACVLATVLGVIAGVLRLSNNWIVARLMTVYVEVFRNIPTLLWILVFGAIMTEAMPAPNAFRGADATASMIMFDSVAITNRGVYVPKPLYGPAVPILGLILAASMIGFFALNRYEKKRQTLTGQLPSSLLTRVSLLVLPTLCVYFAMSGFVWSVVNLAALSVPIAILTIIYLGTRRLLVSEGTLKGQLPSIVATVIAIIIASAWYFTLNDIYWLRLRLLVGSEYVFTSAIPIEIPELRGFNFVDGIHLRNSLIAMWLGLGIYTGAFVAENVRAGILAISKGQTEASFALGIQPSLTMRLVILPQALRVIVPPLISQYLNITKNTSLGLAVGYMDLRSTLGGISINQTGRELEGMLLMMLIYLAISLTISGVMNIYNNRIKLRER